MNDLKAQLGITEKGNGEDVSVEIPAVVDPAVEAHLRSVETDDLGKKVASVITLTVYEDRSVGCSITHFELLSPGRINRIVRYVFSEWHRQKRQALMGMRKGNTAEAVDIKETDNG